jgi:hypothetical protein
MVVRSAKKAWAFYPALFTFYLVLLFGIYNYNKNE